MKVHLVPALGSLPVASLRPEHIQHYYTEALASGRRDGKSGLSGLTVRKHHMVLHKALGFGLKHGMLTRNPCDGVDPPRGRSKKLTILEPDELQLILNVAKETPYYALFFTLAYTGMRRAEAMAIRWADIDWDTSILSVRQTVQQLRNGEYIFKEPKTEHSRRSIALSPSLVIELWEHRIKQEHARSLLGKPLEPRNLVFSHPDGRPFRPNTVTRAFKTIAESVGLKSLRLHDLRHFHATVLLQQNVHPSIVK